MILADVKRIATHILFWLISALFLVFYIGNGSDKLWPTMTTVGLMLPVALATSYTFNYFLFPRYLFKSKFTQFTIYALFYFVLSIYLETMIVLGSFIFLANYKIGNMNPMSVSVLNLGVGLYFIVFLSSLIYLIRRWTNPQEINEIPKLMVRSERKMVNIAPDEINYIESLDNYVKIHLADKVIVSKEKISQLGERLPNCFIRIHRSFLVNSEKIESFTKEKIVVNATTLSISRTYKKEVLKLLESASQPRYQ